MALRAITDAAEISKGMGRIWAQLQEGAQPVESTIGFQGGQQRATVYWRPGERFWTYLLQVARRPESPENWVAAQPSESAAGGSASGVFLANRYWFCFGVTDPSATGGADITCEINVPYQGINRRVAGALVQDGLGQIYLTHSGKVGGGRKGIGKAPFLAFYQGARPRPVLWPDGQETEALLVAEVGSSGMAADIGRFVHQVAAFKSHVTGR
jgi:hypothetical protein